MPYLDVAVDVLAAGAGPVWVSELAPNFHWGLFERGDEHGDTERLVAATVRLNDLVCDCASLVDSVAVLDVGCGFGGTIHHLDTRTAHSHLVGINIDERQLHLRPTSSSDRGNAFGWVGGDGCRLPFRESSFGVVLSVESAFHMDSRTSFFREVARVLRPGGRFVVADFLVAEEPAGRAGPARRRAQISRLADARRALVDFFGHAPAGLVPRRAYERHARASGFTLDQDVDISAGAMPSFRGIAALYGLSDVSTGEAPRSAAALRTLEQLMGDGFVEYHVVTFIRRSDRS